MLQKRKKNRLGHSLSEYYLLKFTSNFCDTILSVNKNNKEVFGKDRVHFIGNYVPNWFFGVEKSKDAKKYDFILIARLSKEKNIPLFLELLKNMNDKMSREYSALIVGEGPEKRDIENSILKNDLSNSVKIEDWVERKELPTIYDLGKCFVISSHHEGFATTLLEAHARGIPSISTVSAGFCAEFIEGYNGKTGLTFNPEDIQNVNFLESLSSLIDNYKIYNDVCIEKAKIFSEDNVLGPIYKACIK